MFFSAPKRQKMIDEKRADQTIDAQDQKKLKETLKNFNNKNHLKEDIEEKLLPNVFSIKLENGSFGVGFLPHGEWMISNAHVVPSQDCLTNVAVSNNGSLSFKVNQQESYHRPLKKGIPDIVILKTNTPGHQSMPASFTESRALEKTLFFYLLPEGNIVYLEPLGERNCHPNLYRCINGESAKPGSSGAPIIEARLLIDHEIKWEFKIVGILYARCPARYYNRISPAGSQSLPPSVSLVCAIPINNEFDYIAKIVTAKDNAARSSSMAKAHRSVGDKEALAQAPEHERKSREHAEEARNYYQRFTDGESSLQINLPDGLEPLFGNGILPLEKSLLIKQCNKETLIESIQKLIEQLTEAQSITLKEGDMFFKNEHFRIDIGTGNENATEVARWVIQLQDNTEKGRKIHGQSASSVFAIVRIPKDQKTIDSTTLVRLLKESMEKLQPIDSTDLKKSAAAAASSSNHQPHNNKPRRR